MNQCKKYQDLFYPYIEGALEPKDEIRLKLHLETCEECQKELAFVKVIQAELQDESMVPVPANFSAILRENLVKANLEKEEPKKKGFLSFLPKYGIAVSAFAAFAIMIVAHNANLQPDNFPSGSDIGSVPPVTSTAAPGQDSQPSGDTGAENQAELDTQSANNKNSSPSGSSAEQGTNSGNGADVPKESGAKQNPKQTTTPQNTKKPVNTTSPQTGGSGSGTPYAVNGDNGFNATSIEPTAKPAVTPPPQEPKSEARIQGLIYVIHGSVDSDTMKALNSLQSFKKIGDYRYQIQRKYQNNLIQALKKVEYSIHFSTELSRFGNDTIIIELI